MAIGRISGPMLFNNLERQGVDLAFQSNLLYLDVNNLRVGIQNASPNYVLDTPGNVKLANIIIEGNVITSNTGKINFGSPANLVISGGTINQVLYTDGFGNVNWGEISQLDPTFGNISLAGNLISTTTLNGNLILAANGSGSVTTTFDFYAGNVYALNIIGSVSSNGGAFTGDVSAPNFLGNLIGSNVIANLATIQTGNAASWYSTNLNSTSGNIFTLVVSNISTGNAVISGGYISSLANATITTGNVSSWYANTLNATSGNINIATIQNFSTANALITSGIINNVNLQANNFSTGNAVISGGYISALSNITVTTGNTESWYSSIVNATNGNITNSLYAGSINTGNAVITGGYINNLVNLSVTTGQVTNFSTANAVITGGYINNLVNLSVTTGQVTNFSTANALITGGILNNIDVQANNLSTANALITGGVIYNVNLQTNNFSTANALITGGVLNNVDVQANNLSTANVLITGGNITANIIGNISGSFGSFSGNINADWFIGKVDASIANFSNVVYANSNLTVAGNLIASGNILGQKITSTTGDLHISAGLENPNNIIRFDSVSALDIASGNTAQRPPSPDSGYLRYNTDQGSIEWWTGSEWAQGAQTITSEIITPDGTNTTYTLNQTTTENSILVNINGTIQQAGSGAYSVSGNQITFSEIPLVTDIIEIRYIAGGIATAAIEWENISSNVTPSANLTYDLGKNTANWRNLYVGGNIELSGNLNSLATVGTPTNTATPASWLKIHVGGIEYYMPLYQ